MKETDRIEILLNKSKITWLFLGATSFIALGILFLVDPELLNAPVWGSPELIRMVGIAAIAFFGIAAFYIIKKLIDKTPGLIIATEGVFDNSSAVSVGFIPWSDVVEITEIRVLNQTLINLELKNPQEYIDRQTGLLKRKTIMINYHFYGTVIAISTNSLKCDNLQLLDILKNSHTAFLKKHKTE